MSINRLGLRRTRDYSGSSTLRAAGLPATNNGHGQGKAAAKPVSRTVVATVCAAISATALTATPDVATVPAATMACMTSASVTSAAGSESVSRSEDSAQQ
ncbi:MAG: hypothetical protein WB347_02625 [Terriglobales bacterium]